ncbi:GIY-YIG nuclease family protein [Candidatus Enterococcus mansonii]|uniref:GIY-YIG domain-containing protein n=1 Tax=Candidatus Enterococcus mansonii TaxID=1834181 RepID=A0A242C5Z6_9ENTE|nr:GIY-YIG nuclease family protein [Enterococcus sp. 4G2_DIV0659]OTO05606.1 hypothetical protein A5880_002779 [Enterococcus sp. 4G2_DIV0659]
MKTTLKEKAKKLPTTPGVYLMKDKQGSILYIGKAKKLNERVLSYFIKNKQHSSKTIRLIHQINDFAIVEVDSELDALLLECKLIQQYRPMYNRQMNAFNKYKYFEIRIKNENISLHIRSTPTKKNCFGPYSIHRKLSELKQILDELYSLNQNDYWHHSFSSNEKRLESTVIESELLNAFRVNNQQPQTRLKEQMIEAANNHSFEKAAVLLEKQQFLTRFFDRNQKLVLTNQAHWQLLWFPVGAKIKYYLLYQGFVLNSRLVTKRTVEKYSPKELADKLMPKKLPQEVACYSKDQVDFINILYSYINRHKECRLIDLDPFFN